MSTSTGPSEIGLQLDALVRGSGFWWTLIIGNVVLIGGQPVVFLMSITLVLSLHGIVWAIDATPHDWGRRLLKSTMRIWTRRTRRTTSINSKRIARRPS